MRTSQRYLALAGMVLAAALAVGCQSTRGMTTSSDTQTNVQAPQSANATTPGSDIDNTRSMGSAGGTSGSAADGK